MLKVLRWLTYPFIVLFVVMAIITAGKVHLNEIPHGAGWGSLFVALALVVSAGGLGWTENANDYSRYLPADTKKWRIVLAVALGGAIPSALLEILGAAVATAVAIGQAGGIASVTDWSASSLPGSYGRTSSWPSSSCSPSTDRPLLLRRHPAEPRAPPASGSTASSSTPIVCRRLRLLRRSTRGGFSLLADFLLFIIVWLGPWCAIYLVDYLPAARPLRPPVCCMNEHGRSLLPTARVTTGRPSSPRPSAWSPPSPG